MSSIYFDIRHSANRRVRIIAGLGEEGNDEDVQSNFSKILASSTRPSQCTRSTSELIRQLCKKHRLICADVTGHQQADQWTRRNYCKQDSQGLAKLQRNITKIKPELTVNPEALLTVKVENLLQFHISNILHACTYTTLRQGFWEHSPSICEKGDEVTHSTSYYPVPSTQIHLQDFPRMTQQKQPFMSSADQDLMRNWANSPGKCLRQCTVRQEITKYKAGTLPLNMYQTAVQRGERLEFAPVENEDNEDPLESVSREEGREGAFALTDLGGDQLSEYDEDSSDNESDDGHDAVEDVEDVEDSDLSHRQNKELGFLFAARRTRSGRMVRTSNRAVLWT
ncbi:hypothetical protein OS493_010156 [Desmophyllum pertusum]|uniref:Uncharacterized protein n=1 Tax=Desmophyllum pertusum TaxID=174260 RepID=A0A9X0CHX8_9CNID|nr:hypothetical protein OS493_010156 [Desmophyllum pertusum]